MAYESYRKLILVLKKKCQPADPIEVRRVKMTSQRDGDCMLRECKFKIRINKELSEQSAIDTLAGAM